MNRKTYRRIQLEHHRSPYMQRQEGSQPENYYIHLLINMRSETNPKEFNKFIMDNLRGICFFNWYCGFINKNGIRAKVCTTSSLFRYCMTIIPKRYNVAHAPNFSRQIYEPHGINFCLDGKHYRDTVENKILIVTTETHLYRFGFVDGGWEFRFTERNPEPEDLPF